jgi:S-adenosylmethionine:tRNA ribosyltransferase-isomerase
VRCSDFSYDLPAELIAQQPLAERSASRLLCLEGETGSLRDLRFADLPGLLERDDLLVFNDTRVVAARVRGSKSSGGAVELLLERIVSDDQALVQIRASKPLRPGLEVLTAGGALRLIAREGDLWRVQLPGDAAQFFATYGEVPLPPYIKRPATALDRERSQSIFARVAGAVAAPTAALHFDAATLLALDARGVARAFVTLHVGAGTFQPLRVSDVAQHRMHSERYAIDARTVAAVAAARARGRRVVAVGTTVARTLESAARSGVLQAQAGETDLFIYPGFRFRVVDALLTNFHLPQSTLLMLVAAFAGTRHVLEAYRHAVAQRYRVFIYGDAMFLTPARAARS